MRANPVLVSLLVVTGLLIGWPLYYLLYSLSANLTDGQRILFFPLVILTLAFRFGGPMLIGIGLFLPFKRPYLGAILGFFFQIGLTLVIYFLDAPDCRYTSVMCARSIRLRRLSKKDG
jgi:hypothetical protein